MPPVQPPPTQSSPNQLPPVPSSATSPPLPTAPLAPATELELEFHEREFRERDGFTRWWSASGQEVISAPPMGLEAELGYLFVYHARSTSKFYVWFYRQDGWRRGRPGHWHPSRSLKQLNLLPKGEPSWVAEHTYKTYKSRYPPAQWEARLRSYDLPPV
ncbi:hypothetical protein EIP86_002077 [Pleurotus ostreatoroseus]|nr:hypothetical protein EIP86_002077 [Pleurotus ostreatoroseus]